jgi:clusterin-associated protein 1
VRELLKISQLLTLARNAPKEEDVSSPPLDISTKIAKLKSARQLGSLITEKGAELYDLLEREMELRDVRNTVISKPFELMTIEKSVNESIDQIKQKLSQTQQGLENLLADESNLLAKIDKKKQELDRAEKRLKSLQSVRPAYMDEYEKIEQELVAIYGDYIEKFRNLAFLEQQLDEHNKEEQHHFEETDQTLKKMQNKLREEELKLMRGEADGSTRTLRANRPTGA